MKISTLSIGRQRNGRALLITRALALTFALSSFLADAATSVTADDYARAERFLYWNVDRYVINGDIRHHWIGRTDRLWYLRTTPTGERQFVVVNAVTGKTTPAFDQNQVAASLSQQIHRDISAGALPFSQFDYVHGGRAIQFALGGQLWICNANTGTCAGGVQRAPSPGEAVSPDGKWVAYVKDHNVWARATDSGQEIPLTTDGVEYYAYAALPGDSTSAVTDRLRPRETPPQLMWSPDSNRILTYRLDERKVKHMYLIQSTPEDGSIRPKLYSYRYALPGDEEIPTQQPVVININTRRITVLNTAPFYGALAPMIRARAAWWSQDSSKVYFLKRDRFMRSVSLNVAAAATGEVRQLLQETSNTAVQGSRRGVMDASAVRTLKNGDILWLSEQDGWDHLYYYNGVTGELRNQVTRGSWIVRNIIHVDEDKRRIYFTAGGRESGHDPYEQRLYRIGLDGSGLRQLTPEEAEHDLHLPADWKPYSSAEVQEYGFSPSGRYFVDAYSGPDVPPVTVLRKADGRLVKVLERADISELTKGGYSPIEPFKVLAADGETEIYGNISRPTHFDPARRYPVIDVIYPGPQAIRACKSFADAMFDSFGAQSLAELGFIVVTIDGRGTPFRSKAFWDDAYGRMGKAGNLEDHIAGIQQLAQRYPYMDLDRVGIWGVSGGGYASAHALLIYPEFYKVAVSAEGNHDQRVNLASWGETYIGPLSENAENYRNASNPPFAANLKGKLLLMHGEMDDNVPPSSTMKLVDALIKANKDFDLLIIPNGNHGAFVSPYFYRRLWDYFVRNLSGAEPPANYEIKSPTR